MAVYLVAAINIDDMEGYAEYVSRAIETLVSFGAEPLALSDGPMVLEGAYPLNRFVLVKFRDQQHLDDWYHSPGYTEARQIRFRTATTSYLMVLDGLISS